MRRNDFSKKMERKILQIGNELIEYELCQIQPNETLLSSWMTFKQHKDAGKITTSEI